jgi:K+ transporter
MHVEEICLSAAEEYLEADQPPEDQKEAAVLEQVNWLRRCQSEFTLFDNYRLAVKTQGLMRSARNYTIDIGMLDPHPKRSFKIEWRYLLIFVLLCGAVWFFASTSLKLATTTLSIILSGCAVLSLVMAIYRSHDRLVFYSQYGRVPLVVLFNRLPDRETLGSFSDALMQRIEEAKAHYASADKLLSKELKAHRCLMEEGVISGKRYDIVKQRILSQHQHSPGSR